MKRKPLFIFAAVLLVSMIFFGCQKFGVTNPLTKSKPFPTRSVTFGKRVLTLQRLNTPTITTSSPDKILNFFLQNNIYFLVLRSNDNDSTSLMAFDRKANALEIHKKFAKDGVMTLPAKMLLSVTRGVDGVVYYIRHGVHAIKSGNDVVSYKDKITATKIALLPGEHQAYLYGNDNFIRADIKDDAFENKHPGFLDNRAAPFRGGLTLVQLTNDGTIYGGGRNAPNGSSQIVAFNAKGKIIKKYGGAKKTDKDAISDLVDMAILKNYICAIDGFTIKVWSKDGTFLGQLDNTELLGENFNGSKLMAMDDSTLGILAYQRDSKTKLIDIEIFALTLPEK